METSEKANILLVDDRPENLMALELILADLGQNLVRATSGAEALRRLLNEEYALILLDVKMPDMTGLEAAALIRARDRSQHTPIIFVTAYDRQDAEVVKAYESGAVDFLFKPIVPTILRSKVAVFVDLYLKAAEIRSQAHRLFEAERRASEREMAEAKQRWELDRLREEMERERELARQLQESYVRLKKLEGLRDDLTHMIVHDLRTPLTSITSSLYTLESTLKLGPLDGEILSFAIQGGHTLLRMINDLLDIGKMEDGSLKLRSEPLNPAQIVQDAHKQIATLAAQKGLILAITAEGNLPHTMGDTELLLRALVNLLGNAIKFTSPGGTVSCSVRFDPGDNMLLFSVEDTGAGIPAHAFARIFEKFGQVENPDGNRAMSTGLGLTFCKLAAEAHGGRISVESEVGKGSIFSLAIPVGHQPLLPSPSALMALRDRDMPGGREMVKSAPER